MRVKNSINNIVYSLFNNIIISILGFISRTVFIYILGAQYLGISGLLQNIFGLLAISELGISTAIGFSLYKPIANNDNNKISTLMTVYKKAYRVIGVSIAIMGLIAYRYLDFFISVDQQPKEITYIYFLYLTNIVIGYFLSYKNTLISSDQKAYKLVPLQIKINIIAMIAQIIYLIIFKNYLGFLTIQIITSLVINFLQNRFITKEYTEVDFNSKNKLSKDEAYIIKRNILGLMISKIGDFCVNSTDNIIIAKFVDIISVGIYSNYILLRNMINGYIGILFGSITSGFGNLVAKESKEKCLEVFNILFFVSFVVYSFESVAFICLFNPFIKLWIGENYLFSFPIVAAIVLNNFLTGLRMPIITMKSAAGIYIEDAWVPFGFSLVNLISSIILGKYFGVFGVIVGSIIGSLCTADWYRPIVIFKKVFEISVWNYFKNYIKYITLGIVYMIITLILCDYVYIQNIFMNFTVRAIICVITPNFITIILFRKTLEFKYIYNLFFSLIKNK